MRLTIIIVLCYIFSTTALCQLDTLGCSGMLGDVKMSILAPDDFQKVNGDCWIFMDGRNIMSSKLGAYGIQFAPDAQGVFIRGVDLQTGAARKDKDRPHGTEVGHYQSDALASHNHVIEGHDFPISRYSTGVKTGKILHAYDYNLGRTSKSTNSTGGTETRPKNIILYYYLRIN